MTVSVLVGFREALKWSLFEVSAQYTFLKLDALGMAVSPAIISQDMTTLNALVGLWCSMSTFTMYFKWHIQYLPRARMREQGVM